VIIAFESPVFFAPTDEDQFFSWLKSLPEFESINGAGTTLYLGLGQPVHPETIRQLLVIFRRWHLDIVPLLPLRSPETIGYVLWGAGAEEAAARMLRRM